MKNKESSPNNIKEQIVELIKKGCPDELIVETYGAEEYVKAIGGQNYKKTDKGFEFEDGYNERIKVIVPPADSP